MSLSWCCGSQQGRRPPRSAHRGDPNLASTELTHLDSLCMFGDQPGRAVHAGAGCLHSLHQQQRDGCRHRRRALHPLHQYVCNPIRDFNRDPSFEPLKANVATLLFMGLSICVCRHDRGYDRRVPAGLDPQHQEAGERDGLVVPQEDGPAQAAGSPAPRCPRHARRHAQAPSRRQPRGESLESESPFSVACELSRSRSMPLPLPLRSSSRSSSLSRSLSRTHFHTSHRAPRRA